VNLGKVGATTFFAATGIAFDRSRNLAGELKSAPNDRVLRISFPADARKSFVLAFSGTGHAPGVPLPDGRAIPLVVDNLTMLSLTRQLSPLVTGNIQFVDRPVMGNGVPVVSQLAQKDAHVQVRLQVSGLAPDGFTIGFHRLLELPALRMEKPDVEQRLRRVGIRFDGTFVCGERSGS